jgi:hypothetical protein
LAVRNDFKNTYAYLNFFKSGEHEDFVACATGGEHKGYQEKDDVIGIFVNFNEVALVKSKAEARKILDKLIKDCPKEAKSNFEQYKQTLFECLD